MYLRRLAGNSSLVHSTKIMAVRRELKAWGANFLSERSSTWDSGPWNSEAAGYSGRV